MGAWCHDATEVLHVVEQDVAVDVGHDEVELSVKTAEDTGITTESGEVVVNTIDNSIMACIVCAPLVDVVAYATGGSQFECADA